MIFSVREIVLCLKELEKSKLFPEEQLATWYKAMAKIDPASCYRLVAPYPPTAVDNWAAFNASCEQIRIWAGLAQTEDYVENQVASQMLSFDENGMYRDPNDPMVYDIVTRNVLATIRYFGYNGKFAEQLDACLSKAAELTLRMQSTIGELPYGGRSNQFLHNEAHLAVCMEYEASRQKKLGNPEKAGCFKAAAELAVKNIEKWLANAPGHHVKNKFPIASGIGCEEYAYYDKYMVTIASFLYLAYLFCDDTILPTVCPATSDCAYTWMTSDAFRKLFVKSGPYFLELETKSDSHYDAAGIGRLHRQDAPSAICLSVSASKKPLYQIGIPNPIPLSICAATTLNDHWVYSSDPDAMIKVLNHSAKDLIANAQLCHTFPGGEIRNQDIRLDKNGLKLITYGGSQNGLLLPAFAFDGEKETIIKQTETELSVFYQGWVCRYHTNGRIVDIKTECTNRNGVYRLFRAESKNDLEVCISIEPL